MTIIRMKRDYHFSYKYAPLFKGTNYKIENLPKELQACVPSLLKSGYAVGIDSGPVDVVGENARSIILEQKRLDKERSDAEILERQQLAREQMKAAPLVVTEDEVITDEVVTDEVVTDEVVTDEVVTDEVVTPARRGRRKNTEE
jgi:hypothetical protein